MRKIKNHKMLSIQQLLLCVWSLLCYQILLARASCSITELIRIFTSLNVWNRDFFFNEQCSWPNCIYISFTAQRSMNHRFIVGQISYWKICVRLNYRFFRQVFQKCVGIIFSIRGFILTTRNHEFINRVK